MAENDCLPQVQACIIRVCALEASGILLPGASSMYVSDALVKMDAKPVFDVSTEIIDKNACGALKVNYKPPDSLKRLDVTIELLTPDPYLSVLLSSGGALLHPVGGGVGYAYPPIGVIAGNGVSVELWAKRIDNGDLDATFPYAWWAFPKIKNLIPGDKLFDEKSQHSIFTGQALENHNWFDGPDNQWTAESDRVAQWIPTATLPVAQCGYEALVAS